MKETGKVIRWVVVGLMLTGCTTLIWKSSMPKGAPSKHRLRKQTSKAVNEGQRHSSASHIQDVHPAALNKSGLSTRARLNETYRKLPLSFEANNGQTNPQVKFLSRGRGHTLFLTSDEAVLTLKKSAASVVQPSALGRSNLETRYSKLGQGQGAGTMDHKPMTTHRLLPSLIRYPEFQNATVRPLTPETQNLAAAVLSMRLVGANPSPPMHGLGELPGKSNYLLGRDPQKWRTNVPNYAKVRYRDIYPGVDLVFYGNQGELEYDFIVAPGSDPRTIKLAIQGARRIEVDAQGDLVADLGGEEMRLLKPVIYQPEKSKTKLRRNQIEGNYVLTGENQIGFEVSAYDPQKALVIDPVLEYSTYLGGSGDDWGSVFNNLRAIAVDPRGNAYVIGTTASTDFPTTADAYQTEFAGGGGGFIHPFGDFAVGDVFVAKLNAAGNALVYSTYLGGSGDDYGEGIAVDAAGNAYLAGMTDSTDFPTMNPIQAVNAGLADMFLAKLNAAGSALVYSTYLGGSDSDGDPMIALDPRGNLYFEAWTLSPDIPTANAFQAKSAGSVDNWVGKVNVAGDALAYSTYLGGSDFDICGSDIVVDPAGNSYLNGFTCSTDFPTLNPFQPVNADNCDAFLTKLNPAGNALVYSTYLGGSDFEFTLGTAVDAAGNAYVTGLTFSSDFPTTSGAFDTTYASGTCGTPPDTFPCPDAFVTKVNAHGNALVYSTFLGGTGADLGHGIVVDRVGNAYIVGGTGSTDFPTVNPLQAANAGDEDVFLTKLNQTGNALVFSTYLGGSSWEGPSGIALRLGDVFIQGSTASTDFPVVNALQPTNAGGLDAFVARIRPTTVSDTDLSQLSGVARAEAKKGGTATLNVRPQKYRLKGGPFPNRVRPGR